MQARLESATIPASNRNPRRIVDGHRPGRLDNAAVIPARILAGLLQPLLALLLAAGVPAVPEQAGHAALAHFAKSHAKLLWVGAKSAGERGETRSDAEPSGGADGSDPIAPAASTPEPGFDRLARTGCPRLPDRPVPLSHRPCAAPPTGPPSA